MTLCLIHALLLSVIFLASLTVTSTSTTTSIATPTTPTTTIATATSSSSSGILANTTAIRTTTISSTSSNTNKIEQFPSLKQKNTILKREISQKEERLINQTVPNISNNGREYFGSGIAGYLLAEATDEKLNNSNAIDATLTSILNRTGPDMRPLRDFEDFDDITVNVSKRAWQLMHEHAQTALVDRFKLMGPLIESVLKSANVSLQCIDAALNTMKAAQQLDSWAIQLLTTWGNFPPTGIYEGTFSDIGSYHGCVNVPQNPIIGHAHYCTVAYRPVMPTRRNYELIVRKEPDELLKLFDRDNPDNQNQGISQQTKYPTTKDEIQSPNFNQNHNQQIYYPTKDAFTDLLNNAQYSHYIYYKFGTCFPIKCSPFDVSKVAKLLGKRSILMSGPVKCHSKYEDDYEFNSSSSSSLSDHNNGSSLQISIKDLNDGIYIWKPHMTTTQFVSLLILLFLTSIMIVSTLIDTIINKLPQFYKEISHKYRKSIIDRDNSSSSSLSDKISSFQARSSMNIDKIETLNDGSKVLDQNNNINSHELNKIHLLSKSSNSIDGHVSEYFKRDISQTISLENNVTYNKHVDLETNKQQTKINQFSNEESKNLQQNDNDKFKNQKQRSLFMDIIEDFSIITNAKQFFKVSQSQLKNDILCINGIRVCTMSWIITNHTMQYNDWSAFARTREIETHLKSLVNQPLFNGSYLVDTFFLMSGLLTSYSSFKSNSNVKNSKGIAEDLKIKFSTRSYLIGRYLRLTPQIMFVSILFILLPQLSRSGGPHWYTITGEYSENCSQNWWINLFHIQAFYHTNEMCNFVCWWISVDMFYHLFALMIILFILYQGHRMALLSCSILAISNGIIQAIKHYQLGLPPNLLSTIPQTGAMWSKMTLEFFWTPYAHAFPYFLGFYIGYLMAQRNSKLTNWFTINRAIYGWLIATSLLIALSYSTYFWVIGKWQYTRIGSTIFHIIGPIIWSTCLGWIILACHYGYGSWVNQILSCKLFIILGKASYIVYLSHFLVLFTFFGSQNLLLEPTQLVMFYVILGNICLSMLLGSVLCVVFEMPWLKTQRRLMKYVH